MKKTLTRIEEVELTLDGGILLTLTWDETLRTLRIKLEDPADDGGVLSDTVSPANLIDLVTTLQGYIAPEATRPPHSRSGGRVPVSRSGGR